MPIFPIKKLIFKEALICKNCEFFDSIILTVFPLNTNTVTYIHTKCTVLHNVICTIFKRTIPISASKIEIIVILKIKELCYNKSTALKPERIRINDFSCYKNKQELETPGNGTSTGELPPNKKTSFNNHR